MNSNFSGDSYRRIVRLVLSLAGLFCLVGIALVGVTLAQDSVTLSGKVTAQSVAEGITIRWETGTETDTQLFHLLRSTDEKGPFEPVPICIRNTKDAGAMVTDIFAQGDISGFSYEVIDLAIDLNNNNQRVDDLITGKTYYYLLVEKDATGYVPYPLDIAVVAYSYVGAGPTPSTLPCPKQADPLVNVTPVPLPTTATAVTTTVTATSTATPSVTPSLTFTPTSTTPILTPSVTPSFTPSFTPSLTPIPTTYPGPATAFPTSTPTFAFPTPTPTFAFPTATLIPGSYPGNADPTPTETPFGADLLTPGVTDTPLPEETPTPMPEAETPTETPTEEPTLTPIPEQPTATIEVETATPTPSPTVTPTPSLTPTRTPVAVANLMPPPRPIGLSAAQVQVVGQPPAQVKRLPAGLGSFVASLAGLGLFFLALALWQMFRRSA